MNERLGRGASMDATEDECPVRPDITRLLPQYRLRQQLSSTLMSEVFRAEETERGLDVALKVIGPELMRRRAFASRFKRETTIAAGLRHPNIVDVYAAGEVGDGDDVLGYLAMRFVEGANLGRVIADRRRLDLEETVAVARQIASALDAAHAQGLVHRDVKPANILVEAATNRYYLCDFGIAKSTAASTVTATGAAMGSALYWSPEQQVNSRDVDRRSDVYSLGCVLYDCLVGLAPPASRARRSREVPSLSAPVGSVLQKAMAVDPADRYATCGELADELAAAAEKTRRRRRLSTVGGRTALGLVAVLTLLLFLVVPGQGQDQTTDLARIPAALRGDCRAATTAMTGAASALSCPDDAGRTAVTSLFTAGSTASRAYRRAVAASGVGRSQGDCVRGTQGEHRYPATGPPVGRVLCYVRDGRAVVVWIDDEARTVSRAEASDATALRRAWTGWTGTDRAFPSADERALVDVAAGIDCVRAATADLDAFPAATAAVTCVPRGSGARSVTYYRFASRPVLRDSFSDRVQAAGADSGARCAEGDAPGFLGTGRHDWLGVDLGQVLCRPESDGTLRMDWSMEPLLVAGTVTGVERTTLTGWWSQWHLAPLSRIVEAVNEQAAPPFPSASERAVVRRVPRVSRINCVRPSPEQVWRDVGAADVTGVACGPTSGAGMVVYYRFRDVAAMRAAYNDSGGGGGGCTDPSNGFSGSGAYSRGGRSGRIRCGVIEGTGERFLEWTDDRRAIAVYAHRGRGPVAMVDWWIHDAGPT
ncbi:MAG: protein kinase [Streptosporangiales bacterium]|nr:protein kinase [Streptosporangiales bacterium]